MKTIFTLLKNFTFIFLSLILTQNSFAKNKKNIKTKNTSDVLIVGAGVAGLSTAYLLKKAGISYTIIEMSPHIGGRVRTPSYPDTGTAEAGLEEFWANNPILNTFKELNVPLEASATAFSSFIYQGKMHSFTQNSNKEFLEAFLTQEELKAYKIWDQKMIEIIKQLEQRPINKDLINLQKISFEEWLKKNSGLSQNALEFIRIETEPEYGTSWDLISALDGIAEWEIFSGEGLTSYHVKGGNQSGLETIADAIGRNNIKLNSQVTHITSTNDGVELTTTDTGSFEQKHLKGKFIVTTMPLFRLNDIHFTPPLTEDRRKAIDSQTWGSYFTAHLILDKQAEKFWKIKEDSILPILSDGPLGVIYGSKSQEVSATTPANQTVLNFLVTGFHAERFNARTNGLDDVREELKNNLENLWPGISAYIQEWTFYRYHPRAIASWPVGRSRFDEGSELMRQPQGHIYFAGDFTGGTHSTDAAQSAIRVSNAIITALKK